MKARLFVLIILHSFIILSVVQGQVTKIETIPGRLEKITAPLKTYSTHTASSQQASLVQQSVSTHRTNRTNTLPAITRSWDGGSGNGVSFISPTIAAGPNHIVQMTNGSPGSLLNIWNKTGTQLVTNLALSALHGFTGTSGYPIALYDKMADRWLLAEYGSTGNFTAPYRLVILVSQTNDPVGQYYVYTYNFGNQYPDAPKYSIWSNAYYCSTSNFLNAGAYTNCSIIAFDRARMLSGSPILSAIKTDLAPSRFISMCPVGFQGGTNPGAADAGMFTYIVPNEVHATPVDSIGIVHFQPNFAAPGLSTVIVQSIVAAPFTSRVDPAATQDRAINQPGTTVKLTSLSAWVMNQPVYRDFGTHKSIFMCHTVGLPGLIAGIRWYELRNTGSGYSMHQQGTYSPDNTHRFMPSLAVNRNGELAIGHMVSNGVSVFPGLRVAGRKATDPLGTLTSYEETNIVAGTVAQTANNRAGNYSHMQVDPTDDLSFWFTGQYFRAPALSGGYSRIAQFFLGTISLPVQFQLFKVACADDKVKLYWKTASEQNSSHFIIEKSADGSSWTGIATLSAAGNTSSAKDYSFTDNVPLANGLYRLAQYDLDGKVEYSSVLKTYCGSNHPITIWPNPVKDQLLISIHTDRSSKVIINVMNSNGALVKNQTSVLLAGTTQLTVDLSDVPSGVYHLQVEGIEGVIRKKISVVKYH